MGRIKPHMTLQASIRQGIYCSTSRDWYMVCCGDSPFRRVSMSLLVAFDKLSDSGFACMGCSLG